jgi:hypothetical protein
LPKHGLSLFASSPCTNFTLPLLELPTSFRLPFERPLEPTAARQRILPVSVSPVIDSHIFTLPLLVVYDEPGLDLELSVQTTEIPGSAGENSAIDGSI